MECIRHARQIGSALIFGFEIASWNLNSLTTCARMCDLAQVAQLLLVLVPNIRVGPSGLIEVNLDRLGILYYLHPYVDLDVSFS